MSSQPDAPAASTPQGERSQRKSLNNIFSRARTVLRRSEGSTKQREQGDQASETGGASELPDKMPAPALTRAQEARARYEAMQGVSRLSKSEMFEERAKKLGERFGIELKPAEWQKSIAGDTVLRTDKPIRMRVRRTCHKCNASFSVDKECPNCQHIRCTKCARYPPKRTEAEIIACREKKAAILKANKENAPITPDWDIDEKEGEVVLTRPARKAGSDLVYKKPRQRVRRTCHECQTLFATGSKLCASCDHVRCTDCPRDPPKKDKYPFGYPGDAFGPNSIPRFECAKCTTLHPENVQDGTKCKVCGLEKSDASPRAQPRKVEPEPDPEVVKRLAARLAALNVSSGA